MIRLALASFLLAVPLGLAAQQYQEPPLTVRQLIRADPGFDRAIDAADKQGGNPAIQKMVLEQANAGKLIAQMYLAEMYLPQECLHVPDGATVIGRCDPDKESVIGLKPSFEQAFFWLRKASVQGSGEATEMLAEQTERMLLEHRSTNATEADVARLHALARKQGYDEERISVGCTKVDRTNTQRLHSAGKPGPYDVPPKDVIAARAIMPRGEIGNTEIQSIYSEFLEHPEGPDAFVWVLLDHAVTRDIVIPMPLRSSVLAVQRGDGVVLLPANPPHNGRVVTLHTKTPGVVEVQLQQTDGEIQTRECLTF